MRRRLTGTDNQSIQTPSATSHLSDLTDFSYTQPCLLPLLQPVRHCLHTFLSDQDAARLMRVSRAIAASLLADYAFVDHVFAYEGRTVADVKPSFALYARYRMRILRMCLPRHWNESLVDCRYGRSVLPPSLIALTTGHDSRGKSVAYAALDGSCEQRRSVEEVNAEAGGTDDSESEFHRLIRPVTTTHSDTAWDVFKWGSSTGRFNQPITPAALPLSLRFLHFNDQFNQPLQQGSIPDSVEVLQFGAAFNQPLEVGHLPASLTLLVFAYCYNQPLPSGVLPAGLRRLHLGINFNQFVPPATLPPQLQQLSFGYNYNQPIVPAVIPSSVTHLRLGHSFNQPLQCGSIPHGVVHLNLGHAFNHPLLPGVLPTSLRELVISQMFNKPLQPGSLPDGLEVLALPHGLHQPALQPGVIPASVSVLSMDEQYTHKLGAGAIPSTVRWLRLPTHYRASQDLSTVLSPSTRVVWWKF